MRKIGMIAAAMLVSLTFAGCGDVTVNPPSARPVVIEKTVVEKPVIVEKKIVVEKPVIIEKTVVEKPVIIEKKTVIIDKR